jgi:hypothetical protein
VLWPLLLLLIPLSIHLAARHFLREGTPEAARWISLGCSILAIALVVWVAIRGSLFLRSWLAFRHRELAQQRRDPLFIVESKMRERIATVLSLSAKMGKKKHDLPIFAIIADKSVDVNAFLSGSGVVFPRDLQMPQGEASETLERWHLGTEALFVDLSALLSDARESELGAFLGALESARPLAPLNGSLLLFSRKYLQSTTKEAKEKYASVLRQRLQRMQERLKVKYPSYVFTTGIDEIAGFQDFFKDLNTKAVGQILGWSNRDSHQTRLDLARLSADITRIKRRIDDHLLRRMERQADVVIVDRMFGFTKELGNLLDALFACVTSILAPNLYLDPIPLRGCYLCGGSARTSLHAGLDPVGNATAVGEPGQGAPGGTMIGDGKAIEQFLTHQNWFCKDVFTIKIIREGGNLSRPNWIAKRQRKLAIAGLAVLSLQFVLFSFMVVSGIKDSSDWRSKSDAVLARAQDVLLRGQSKEALEEKDRLEARQSLQELKELEQVVLQQEVFDNTIALGRRDDILSRLREIHQAIFQTYFLTDLIKNTERQLSNWQGKKLDTKRIAQMLVEYVRWSNNAYQGDRRIDPFLDWSSEVKAVQEREFYLSHYREEASQAASRLIDPQAEKRIVEVLEALNGPNRVTLPMPSNIEPRTPAEREWQWWQKVGNALKALDESFSSSVALDPIEPRSGDGDPVDRIFELSESMKTLVTSIDQADELLVEGAQEFPYFAAAAENLFSSLDEAAKGWPAVDNAIRKSRERTEHAYENLVDPILNSRIHLYQMFTGGADGPLKGLLERLAVERAKINPLSANLYTTAGNLVKELYKGFFLYTLDMQKLIETSGALVSTSDFYKEEEIIAKLEDMRVKSNDLIEKEKKVRAALQQLDELLTVEPKSDPAATLRGKSSLKEMGDAVKQEGKDLAKGVLDGDFLKREVSDKYQISSLSTWVMKWHAAVEKERRYILALYWTELFDWYQTIRKPTGRVGWNEVMAMGPFAHENEMQFVEGIDKFLQKWLATVPAELIDDQEKQSGLPRPELSDFRDLYAKVEKFRTIYIPELRQATSSFVKAVRTLRGASQDNLRNISSAQNPDFSWDALKAFSNFKTRYEMNEGLALGNVTGPLLGLENGLSSGLNQRVRDDFNTRWKELLVKARENMLHERFPFSQQGMSANQTDIIALCENAAAIGTMFGILDADTGDSNNKDNTGGTLLRSVISADRKAFIERCHQFTAIIRGGEKVPEVTVRLESGEIGKHYHWVRMRIGSVNYFDLGVYGKNSVVVGLLSNLGGVSFAGLDINRMPKSESSVTKGDLGILQLVYTYGKSMDKSRKKWMVKSQLGASDSDGVQVSFAMIFEFNTPLPELPVLPE